MRIQEQISRWKAYGGNGSQDCQIDKARRLKRKLEFRLDKYKIPLGGFLQNGFR